MAECVQCGTQPSAARRCSYCGEATCKDHLLPENHDCVALSLHTGGGKHFESDFPSGSGKRGKPPAKQSRRHASEKNTPGKPDFRTTSLPRNGGQEPIPSDDPTESDTTTRTASAPESRNRRGERGSPTPPVELKNSTQSSGFRFERLRKWATELGWRIRILGIRLRGMALTALRFAGLCLVIWGGYNFVFAPITQVPLAAEYWRLFSFISPAPSPLLSFLFAMALGGAVVWFV